MINTEMTVTEKGTLEDEVVNVWRKHTDFLFGHS